MTVDQFHEKINELAMARMSLERYCLYLRHDTREDKYLHEEYLAIQAVILYEGYPGYTEIELGDERENWDARVGGVDLFEVVQALPADEHVIRNSIAGGETKISLPVSNDDLGNAGERSVSGPLARLLIQNEHSCDHFQFPQAIVEAIQKKHEKNYSDIRTLIVVFDGDYSFEEDQIVEQWIELIKQQSFRGSFKAIHLFELGRRKVLSLF